MPRGLSPRFDQVAETGAALQHNFPKPAVRITPNHQNPIRLFAAGVFDVSVADEVSYWHLHINGCFQIWQCTAFAIACFCSSL